MSPDTGKAGWGLGVSTMLGPISVRRPLRKYQFWLLNRESKVNGNEQRRTEAPQRRRLTGQDQCGC
jgi:hypothetical protein